MNDTLPLEFDDDVKAAIASAFPSQNWVTVGYNGEDGWPQLSRRGTTRIHGPQQIAFWARKRDEGLVKALATRPELTFFFLDLSIPQLYTFYGRGHVSTDPELDDQIYRTSPEGEQAQDPEKQGVAVIAEIERLVARGAKNYVAQR